MGAIFFIFDYIARLTAQQFTYNINIFYGYRVVVPDGLHY